MKLQSSERRRGHTGLPGLVLGAGRSGGQHWAVGSQIERPGVGGGPPPTRTARQLCSIEIYSIK